MSKLIVNEIEKYDAGQLTITTGTNVSIGSNLTVSGSIAGTLSTAAQTNITSVGTLSNLVISGDLAVDTNTLKVDTANNRIGISTSSPQQKLHVAGIADNSYGLITTATNWTTNIYTGIKIGSTADTFTGGADLRAYTNYGASAVTSLALWVNNPSNTMVEVVRATSNGLTFNGDTAAANALDDYEEGTWTPTITNPNGTLVVAGFDGTGSPAGQYTKVGRLLTLFVQFQITDLDGASSGPIVIGGLPFNCTLAGGVGGQGVIPAAGKTLNVSRVNNTTLNSFGADGSFAGSTNPTSFVIHYNV